MIHELPDLRNVGIVALDTEENDEGLRAKRGSGWPWHGGWICGVSIAWREGGEIPAFYAPIQHPDSDNFSREQVARWLKDHITAGVKFATLNAVFDWGWLGADLGILMPPAVQIEEVGALAVTVDENLHRYGLDALCEHYGLPGKDEALLRQAVENAGFAPKRKKKINIKDHIGQLPARFVAPYAGTDAVRTLELFEKFNPILDQENTRKAYELDRDLQPMVLEMRRRGIRIDQDAAEQARDLLLSKRDAALAELSSQLGTAVGMEEINGRKWKEKTFEAHGIGYPKTPKGNPSFAAGKSGWMAKHQHWLPQLIAAANKYDAAGSKFIEGHILKHIINGRIHAEIHPFRAEDGGTRSSRFSYSDPPLQQMPIRDPELGPLIRRVFLAEVPEFWAKPDISQQEFRWVVHDAVKLDLPGAREAAEVFRTNPDADFHQVVADMTGLDRDTAKAVNFAKIYGAGIKKMAEMIGKPVAKVQTIVTQYDQKLPFVAKLSAICQEKAARIGYTVLYDGARRHWNLYEVPWIFAKGAGPCEIAEARRRIADPDHAWYGGRLSRANVYTALNAQIQGTAARHTKLWMREVWRAGIVPLLQMHDCLDCSVSSREQAELVAQLGCDCVSAEVPMRVDLKFGRSWGDATHSWEELTGEAAPSKPAFTTIKPAPASGNGTKTVPPRRPAIVIPPKPAIVAPSRAQPIETPPPPPPPIDETETEIDLADLIDEPVPRDRKILCPFHDENTPSMRIYPDHYYCYGCGAWGDHLDWLVEVEGLSDHKAREVLDNWDGPVFTRSAAVDAKQDAQRTTYALTWWDAAREIKGTLAARYLRDVRGINLDVLPDDIGERALRFHPNCVFGQCVTHPCLLALMRDPVSGQPSGIQRSALNANAEKLDRRMLGFAGVVQLWPAGKQLVIGEGLETVLAAATRLDYRGEPLRPAWAALSDGAMERFPVLSGVERLIVLADNDANGVGQAAADACKRRWLEAGRRVALLTPDRPGTDFNDIVLEQQSLEAAS
jgi:DNA polymerase I-like protein with 3'-5' exonuclease and polymerase domains